MKPTRDGEGVARHQPPGNFLEPNIERDKVEEMATVAPNLYETFRLNGEPYLVQVAVVIEIERLQAQLFVSEKRAEEMERIAGLASEHRDQLEAKIDALTSERDSARSSLMRVEAALRKNLGTLEWTVGRCEHWGKSHDELDTAIKETRSALSPHPERETQ